MQYAKRLTALATVAFMFVAFMPRSAAQPLPEPQAAISQASVTQITVPQSSRVSREAAVARGDRADDMRGPMPSLYRGKFFRPYQERFRLCVADREGSYTYMVRGGGNLTGDSRGDYYGTYQFSYKFQRGAAYMMASESRVTKDGLRKAALKLRFIPINKWNRYWQDRAFYTVLNFRGDNTGKHHWNGGRWSC